MLLVYLNDIVIYRNSFEEHLVEVKDEELPGSSELN